MNKVQKSPLQSSALNCTIMITVLVFQIPKTLFLRNCSTAKNDLNKWL